MKQAYIPRLFLILTTMVMVSACSNSSPSVGAGMWDQAFAQSMKAPKKASSE